MRLKIQEERTIIKMSLEIPQPILCANWDCRIPLGDYELTRITNKFNKYRFCPTCRRKNVTRIECMMCHTSMDNNGQCHYCKSCQEVRKARRNRLSYRQRSNL